MSGITAALVLLAVLGGAAAAEPMSEAALRFDPFAAAPEPKPTHATPAQAASVWRPLLRGTLAAGPDSLADLGGVVLSIGAETHGYRLLEVRPWEAVFEKDGARVVLPVERGGRE